MFFKADLVNHPLHCIIFCDLCETLRALAAAIRESTCSSTSAGDLDVAFRRLCLHVYGAGVDAKRQLNNLNQRSTDFKNT